MNRVPIQNVIAGLREISESNFTCDHVYEYLEKNPVDVDSISIMNSPLLNVGEPPWYDAPPRL